MTTLVDGFGQAVEVSWRVTPLLAAFFLVRFGLRRLVAPRWIFAGWLLLAGLCLFPWRLPVAWHPLAERPQSAPAAAEMAEFQVNDRRPFGLSKAGPSVALRAVPIASPAPAPQARPEMARLTVWGSTVLAPASWVRTAALVWGVGVGLFLLFRVTSWARLRVELRRTRRPADPALIELVGQVAAETGLRRLPEVVVTPLVQTPAVFGCWRPTLLMPPGFAERVTVAELRWVIRHELAHLWRRDLLAQAWLQLALAVHWFNPLVWLAVRTARYDCELACDDLVLRRHARNAEERVAYGQTLLAVLGGIRRLPRLPAAVGIVENQKQFMRRIVRIAEPRQASWWRAACGVLILASVAVAGGTQPGAVAPAAKPPAGAVEADRMPDVSDLLTKADEVEPPRAPTFELCGVGRRWDVPVALVAVNGDLSAVIEGSRLLRYRVTRIDVESRTVVLQPMDGPVQTLSLEGTNLWSEPDMKLGLKDRIRMEEDLRRYVLSKRNIQNLATFRGPPSELSMVWSKVSREGQVETLTRYLEQGLAVQIIRFGSGRITAGGDRLLERQIRDLIRGKHQAFILSLSAEQREAYDEGRERAIAFTAPVPERAKQQALANEAKARREQVLANLTPEQKVLYDEWRSWLTPMEGARES